MIKTIKSYGKTLISLCVISLSKTRVGSYFFEQVFKIAMQATKRISHKNVNLTFCVPNQLNRFRVDTFATKEPETLEWIETIPQGSTFWDIGANIGLYSLYAARARGCSVYAFEPSVFNLELLARNIHMNGLTEQVIIVPCPLSNRLAVNTLNMTSTEWGGALSTFGQEYGWDGLPITQIFAFKTIGISADDAVNFLHLPSPDYIKIDVDGIEHLILNGGMSILKTVKGILIEINDNFYEQASSCHQMLSEAGLVLQAKLHSEMFDLEGAFGDAKVWNQIWRREHPSV